MPKISKSHFRSFPCICKWALWSKRSISPWNWSYYKTVLNYNVGDTAYLQTVFGRIQSSTKRILVSQETQLQDSYNLNTFSGPGRNAYKNIFVLQKPVLHQKNLYRMRLYKTLCGGRRTQAFVDKMVSPIEMGSPWVSPNHPCSYDFPWNKPSIVGVSSFKETSTSVSEHG